MSSFSPWKNGFSSIIPGHYILLISSEKSGNRRPSLRLFQNSFSELSVFTLVKAAVTKWKHPSNYWTIQTGRTFPTLHASPQKKKKMKTLIKVKDLWPSSFSLFSLVPIYPLHNFSNLSFTLVKVMWWLHYEV